MGIVKSGYDVSLKAGSWNPVIPAYEITVNGCIFCVTPPKEKAIYKFEFSLCKYPTSNCQVSSIGRIDSIMSHIKSGKEIFEVLEEAHKLINIKMLFSLVDCKDYLAEQVEMYFPVIHKNMYTSANGSKMCMFLVNLRDGCKN